MPTPSNKAEPPELKGIFPYYQANKVALDLVTDIGLFAYQGRIEICGGLRRVMRTVHDIDIVMECYGESRFILNTKLPFIADKYLRLSQKTAKFGIYQSDLGLIPVEVYFVDSPDKFEVMKLIRTGNNYFNMMLTMKARAKNSVLRFSGDTWGVYPAVRSYQTDERTGKKQSVFAINKQRRLATTEQEIIAYCMEGDYIEPWQRNFNDRFIDEDYHEQLRREKAQLDKDPEMNQPVDEEEF